MNLVPSRKNLASISKRSDSIFNVFTKTKSDAESLIEEIKTINAEKQAEAQKILDEVKALEEVAVKNANLVKKIDAFINS